MTFNEWMKQYADGMLIDAKGTQGDLLRAVAHQAWCAAREEYVAKWLPMNSVPTDRWVLMKHYEDNMIGGQPVMVDKLTGEDGVDTVYTYIHNYAAWMPLPELPPAQR